MLEHSFSPLAAGCWKELRPLAGFLGMGICELRKYVEILC